MNHITHTKGAPEVLPKWKCYKMLFFEVLHSFIQRSLDNLTLAADEQGRPAGNIHVGATGIGSICSALLP